MSLSRRHFVAASLAALAGGCAERIGSLTRRPGPTWPHHNLRPSPVESRAVLPPVAIERPAVYTPRPAVANQLNAIPRARWANAGPVLRRLEGMGSINRITVHHEGYKPVYFDDYRSTADRLELIRQSHLGRMRAGDIGYHYIVDRAGRIWEGRPLTYQGAHAGGANNRHNIGVMVLGNFDQQSPSEAQMQSLVRAVGALRQQYYVAHDRIYTHQELSPTRCPGKVLQPRMVSLRRNQRFA